MGKMKDNSRGVHTGPVGPGFSGITIKNPKKTPRDNSRGVHTGPVGPGFSGITIRKPKATSGKKMASDASIPHAGMELHKHAKKVYKKLAPKVLAYAKELANKGGHALVDHLTK